MVEPRGNCRLELPWITQYSTLDAQVGYTCCKKQAVGVVRQVCPSAINADFFLSIRPSAIFASSMVLKMEASTGPRIPRLS
jgi:hypothetical protein